MTKQTAKSQPLWMKVLGALVLVIAGALGLLPKDEESTDEGSRARVEERASRPAEEITAKPPSIRVEEPVREEPTVSKTEPAPKSEPAVEAPKESSSSEDDAAAAKILAAYKAHRSDMWIQGSGHVDFTLPDDNEGSRHQKFVLRLSNGHTVMIAHNIDLAPRVPLERGDLIRFYGEYEWNDRGGVVHWTHHDPRGRRGGWLELDGRRYE